MHELKLISLILAFFFPLAWALSYVFTGKIKQRSGFYMFLVLVLASFTYMMTYFKFENHINLYSILFPLQAGVVLMLFPTFFIYIKSITSEEKLKHSILFYHFLVSIAISITFFVLQKILIGPAGEEEFIEFLLDKHVVAAPWFETGKIIYNIGKLCFVFSALAYVIAIFITLRQHYNKIKEVFADSDSSELRWIRVLGYMLLLLTVFFVIIHILSNDKLEPNSALIASSYFMFALFFWYAGLNGFRQPEVYNMSAFEPAVETELSTRISRKQIEKYLTESKCYRNSEVSVFDFCYHFHTNRTYMSEAIRLNFNTNFRGLINSYRIKEAMEMITEAITRKHPIELERIASLSGFSSYSTFLRVFKAETGIRPTDFIKEKQP
ncbi:MAG TPA: helix-turn-helix domain-containing protein [Bacteroidales bacterium]|nr:helix-turn-helix domain-containing protein [Bacteroidales bacterium]